MKERADLFTWLWRFPPVSWITDDEALQDDDATTDAEGFPSFEAWSEAEDCPPDEIAAGWQRMRGRLELGANRAGRQPFSVRLTFWRPAIAAALVAGVLIGVVGGRLLDRSRHGSLLELNTELVDILRTRRSSQVQRGGALATLIIFAPRHVPCERYGVQILDRHEEILVEAWGLVLDPVDLTFTLTVPSDLLLGPGAKLRLLGSVGDSVEVLEVQPLPSLGEGAPDPGGEVW